MPLSDGEVLRNPEMGLAWRHAAVYRVRVWTVWLNQCLKSVNIGRLAVYECL